MNQTKNIGFIDIPNDWGFTSLGDKEKQPLKEMMNGYSAQQNKFAGEYKVSRIETISDGYINDSKVQYLSKLPQNILDKYLIKKGDILFSHINSDKHLGKTGLAGKDYSDLLHGMNLLLFRVNEKVINPDFLNFVFNCYREKGVFIRICSRAVNQSSINQSKLKALNIPLPKPTEQRNISHILSLIQSAIQKQEEIINTTTKLKNALMQKLFTEGTKGEKQKETEIGLVPESWEVVELGSICNLISSSYEPKPNGNKNYVGLEHIISGIPKIKNYGSESDVVSNKNQFKKGQIIYGKLRPYLDKAAIPHFDGICSSDILVFDGSNNVSNDFLIQFFHFEKFIQHAKSTTTGVQHPRTSWSSLKKFKLGLPKEDERKLIVETFSSLDKKIEFHQTKKQTLTSLFKSMLQKLMAGEVVNNLQLEKEYKITEEKLSIAAEE